MTRVILSFLLAMLALVLGLRTAFVQVDNCARAAQLSDFVREIEMLECTVAELEALCQGYVHPLLRPAEPSEYPDGALDLLVEVHE